MPFASRFRPVVLAIFACVLVLPLRGQGDPRLQSVNTDLLDLYKVSAAKPELLTIFDFSGSMHAVYWQQQYYTNANQDSSQAQWNFQYYDNWGNLHTVNTVDDFPGIVPAFDINGYIHMMVGTGYYGEVYNYSESPVFADPYGGNGPVLVAPNGTVIAIDHTQTYSRSQLQTFANQASHIRVTATANVVLNGVSQSVTRTIDLPIPWAIMDPTATGNNNAYSTITYVTDPSGGPSVTPDTLYQSSNEYNIVNAKVVNGWINNGQGGDLRKIGRFHYTMDYLWWVFFGTKVRNSTNNGSTDTGHFVIPAYQDSLGSGFEPTSAPLAAWPTTTYPATTWNNGLVGYTRFQALKNAVVRAWFANQTKVWWGYRYIDDNEDGTSQVSADNGSASATTITRDIRLFRTATSTSTPDQQLSKFLGAEPQTSTPLAHALANAYAQLAQYQDSNSTFGTANVSSNGQSGTENPIPPCRTSFVVVFTDGIANDQGLGTGDPYAAGTAATGNSALGSLSNLMPGKDDFNIWTLAGVAAHYQVGSYTSPSGGGASSWEDLDASDQAPWLITSRGATPSSPRRARTMTVAMSVAGSLADTASGKADLFRAALYGNPNPTNHTWNLNTPPFDPTNPSSDPNINPFFFDATDVNKLSSAVTAILAEVTKASAAVAAPSSPLVGLSLGNQVYLGLFETADGPRWQGDLLMAGLQVNSSSGVSFLDRNGNVVQNINASNAVWSANYNVFNNKSRTWKTRNIYTNLPGTTTVVPFDESNAQITNAMVGATNATDRTAYIRFMRGAETAAETDASDTNPRWDIMGDIVSSSPAVLEYPHDSALLAAVSPKLASLAVPSGATPHFRVIFVGDNQGIFHAFGEVSWTIQKSITTTDASGNSTTVNVTVPQGDVDELWAFIPGEFLQYIPQLRNGGNPHRYRMDGSPYIYFDDVPAAGQSSGDGVVDGSDVVRVIAGERKGGRSYYAFDFSNLASLVANTGSTLAWKLVPDDILTTTTDSQQKVLARMGFSTCTPAVGTVDTTTGTENMVFLGGGMSTQSVDSAFAPTYGSGTKLGRSLVAFDVVKGPGTGLHTWDFTTSAFTQTFFGATGGSMGCVSAGVMPFVLFPNSQRVQRVYFTDTPTDANSSAIRGGAVWALGNNSLATNGVIRLDSSSMDDWTSSTNAGIRKILQAPLGWSMSTSPIPFRLGGDGLYPVARISAPTTDPLAVGVIVGTGDRNDPMDNDSINPAVVSNAGKTTTAYNNWLAVAFDRQDSASLSGVSGVSTTNLDTAGIQLGKINTDGDLADLTTMNSFTGTISVSSNSYSVDPSNSAYYLKQKLGYKLNMGAARAKDSNNYYYPKVITEPAVLTGVLFFSDFSPQVGNAAACAGAGVTNTYRICNVMEPTFNSGKTLASSTTFNSGDPTCSGTILTFPNLPGALTALGTSYIIQSGQGVSTSGTAGTIDNAGAHLGSGSGLPASMANKPRTWRIVR